MTSIAHSMSAVPEYVAAPGTGAAVGGAGAAFGAPALPPPPAGEGWGGGIVCAGFEVAAAVPPESSVRITFPSLTLSPSLTLTSLTVPAAGEGTSIVALSDSNVTSESSAFTVSPGLTKTSMTGTSLKSPMSGTLTSIAAIVRLLEHYPAHVAEERDEVAIEAGRRCAIDHAVIPGKRQRQDQPGDELLAVP